MNTGSYDGDPGSDAHFPDVVQYRESKSAGGVGGTQAISRAFAVLRLFTDRATDLGVAQVGKELGLTLSTTHRIIRALTEEGYLAQNQEGERYHLGRSALLLGQAAQRNFGLDSITDVLRRLATATGESVNLGVLDGNAPMVVQRIESSQPLRFSQPVGSHVVVHATSMGKALLAFNTDLERRVLTAASHLSATTPNTITSLPKLQAELAEIRERGWSTDDEESIRGVRCVGAAVPNPGGEPWAAIAIQAPAVRMPYQRFAELGPEVVRVAHEVAGLMPVGYQL